MRFTADVVFSHKVFGGNAHVVVVERIPQAIADHGVDDLTVAHAQTGAGTGHDVVGQAHVFLAAGDDHLGIAASNGLGPQVQGLEARPANLVQGQCRYRKRQAGLDCRLAGRVLPGTGGQYLTHDHFVDLGAIQASLCE